MTYNLMGYKMNYCLLLLVRDLVEQSVTFYVKFSCGIYEDLSTGVSIDCEFRRVGPN